MSGLKIKTYKLIKDGQHSIGVQKSVKYDGADIKKYIEKFERLKENGIVILGNFYDMKWTMLGRQRVAYFYFSDELDMQLVLAIKMYLILKIYDEKISPRTMLIHYYSIMFVIEKTNGLMKEYEENLNDSLNDLDAPSMKENILFYAEKFLLFYNSFKFNGLINILIKERKKYEAPNRRLPNFRSTIFFEHIVEEFMRTCSRKEKHKYFPVILWWNITKSIPMRPYEFSELEMDCATEVNGNYFLKIINDGKRVLETNSIQYRNVQITKELYDLIHEFIEIKAKDNDSNFKYLLDFDVYSDFSVKTKNDKVLEMYRENLGGTGRFYSLLNKFYDEIIEDKFNFKTTKVGSENDKSKQLYFERIRPGDTRHFAICNLYLQGFNPLTIARLAGHKTLNIQLNYAKHMGIFAESSVKVLTDRIISKKSVGLSSDDIRKVYRNSLVFNKELSKSVNNGYCVDQQFPNNCINDECIMCDYFRIDLDNKNISTILINKSKNLDGRIKRQVDIMRKIIRDTTLNKSNIEKNKNINIKEQQEIGVASKELQSLMSKKAIVDSYIFDTRKVMNDE